MKNNRIKYPMVIICTVILLCIVLGGCSRDNDTNCETTCSVTTTTEEIEEIITTEYEDNNLDKTKGIVQPTIDAENYFAGGVEITIFVEPDKNGHYIVEESQWTLDLKNKTLDQEVESRLEEFEKLGVEVIETSTKSDGSASFSFDEENYKKMVGVIEDLTNDRTGLYGSKVSISKNFGKVIMYVDESRKLVDFYSNVSFLSWSIFQCQAYSGIDANNISILLQIVHIDSEDVLMELTLDMNTSFDISEEEWAKLFE